MSELREAAQEALFWMEKARLHLTIKERLHPDGLYLYDSAIKGLRTALAQPETAEPVAWAVMCDGSTVQTFLTETVANLIAENRREQNRGRDFDWQTIPLYAHPPRDEWREAASALDAAKPLIKWLNDNHNPHTTAIVTTTGVEILAGIIAEKTTKFVHD